MIELKHNQLTFSFPEVHRQATLTIEFQRTLRIPDDDRTYPLPPGLGAFPLRHVDDHAANVPSTWLQRGGVMLPMYQSEAMWLNFSSATIADRGVSYPFAIKVATGKQCAVSGEAWTEGLRRGPQNYLVAPRAAVAGRLRGRERSDPPIRCHAAGRRLLRGRANHGKGRTWRAAAGSLSDEAEVFERRFSQTGDANETCRSVAVVRIVSSRYRACHARSTWVWLPAVGCGRRSTKTRLQFADWETDATSRCFVHLCNSLVWQAITGSHPPHPAPTVEAVHQSRFALV